MLEGARPRTFAPQVSSITSTMRGARALAWLACVGACAGHLTKPSPRAAKQDAVDEPVSTAGDVSSGKATDARIDVTGAAKSIATSARAKMRGGGAATKHKGSPPYDEEHAGPPKPH